MTKKKGKLGAKRVDADAVKLYWAHLPIDEKLEVLRFQDRAMFERVRSVWQNLSESDLTCLLCGIRTRTSIQQDINMSMFALEGHLNDDGSLYDVDFHAKFELAGREDLLELIERHLGRPLGEGARRLTRESWSMFFQATPNSWSQFLQQILTLLEAAILQAEHDSRNKLPAPLAAEVSVQGRSAKRRARKKRTKLAIMDTVDASNRKRSCSSSESSAAANLCPVCDGTGFLLSDPCPLCADSATEDGEEEEERAQSTLCEEHVNDCTLADAEKRESGVPTSCPSKGNMQCSGDSSGSTLNYGAVRKDSDTDEELEDRRKCKAGAVEDASRSASKKALASHFDDSFQDRDQQCDAIPTPLPEWLRLDRVVGEAENDEETVDNSRSEDLLDEGASARESTSRGSSIPSLLEDRGPDDYRRYGIAVTPMPEWVAPAGCEIIVKNSFVDVECVNPTEACGLRRTQSMP
eukprot:TRINITY_DN985_c0_g1_i1.p1 TRINITY_DN985_c0_g1~~TRINITY_DN985_c0_g1_i1.p1  ORF type:complete len:465 (-),score=57.48 TRINITY_DN985_c0_g1_i1:271-1665(-)